MIKRISIIKDLKIADKYRISNATEGAKMSKINDLIKKLPLVAFGTQEFAKNEQYKRILYERYRKILDTESWTEQMVGTGEIVNRFDKVITDSENNLVNQRFNSRLYVEKAKSNIIQSERILYDIYKTDNNENSFNNAIGFFGARYELLAFLFFLIDKDRFVPARPSFFEKIFKMLELDTACLRRCSWENYIGFIKALEEIKNEVTEAGYKADLLDIHSLVWISADILGDASMINDRIKPVNEWIIPCNLSLYNLQGALSDLKIIDWKQVQSMKNAQIGDIIYIYCSAPISKVCYKGAIIKTAKPFSTINDSNYGGNPAHDQGLYMEIAVFREYSLSDGCSYKDLSANGLIGTLIGPRKINPMLSTYLHSLDRQQIQVDRMDGGVPETCLIPFPLNIDEMLDGCDESEIDKNTMSNEQTNVALNTILYGPPGTGKTYNTMIYAVAIVENVLVETIAQEAAIDENHYKDVRNRYREYCEQKRIAFTTFHQSYGYEEFIEGLRPVLENDMDNCNDNEHVELEYELRPGVFKRFCDEAKILNAVETGNMVTDINIDRDAIIWKISLEGAGDNPTRIDCMENGYIRIGWDQYGEDIDKIPDDSDGLQILKRFKDELKIGDIVLSCYSKRTIDAIGIITGEYKYLGTKDYYNRARAVKWIVTGINEDIVDINGGKVLTLSTLYKLNKITVNDVLGIIKKYIQPLVKKEHVAKNHVMIIDEINRGNISKIFGELITLIEETKREDADEEMSVVLPYSQKPFSVPKNIYILGTMNTADRSIALMDTALRRRFSFVEMMPKPELLHDIEIEKDGVVLDIESMLSKMNERITYLYDREHTIGHAFFMKMKKKEYANINTLADIFRNSIIPLLQEYFYEDYNKIQLVLGDNGKDDANKFIVNTPIKSSTLFAKNSSSSRIQVPEIEDYEFTYSIQESAFSDINSYIRIYQ